jgi:hypothetical protein
METTPTDATGSFAFGPWAIKEKEGMCQIEIILLYYCMARTTSKTGPDTRTSGL